MDKFLVHVDRDVNGHAFRVWPIIKNQPDDHVISIIHGVASSQPVIDTGAVPVFVVYGRFTAGEKVSSIAKDFKTPESKVRRAIRYVERKEEKKSA